MNILEKEIEDLIYENLINDQSYLLTERGLPFDEMETFGRQINLGKYGILDLVGLNFNRDNRNNEVDVFVIEIKKGEINMNTYLQSIRYCKGLSLLFEKSCMIPIFHQILIGTSINTSDDFIFLPDINDRVRLFTMKISLDKGIVFANEKGYKYSQYDFDLNKSVLERFKSFIRKQIEYNIEEKIAIKEFFNTLELNEKEN